VEYLKAAAHRDYVPACLSLGKLLYHDARIDRDIHAALKLFEKAAIMGSAIGWNSMGVCHEELGNFSESQRCYR
jgi:TPR repeat protein